MPAPETISSQAAARAAPNNESSANKPRRAGVLQMTTRCASCSETSTSSASRRARNHLPVMRQQHYQWYGAVRLHLLKLAYISSFSSYTGQHPIRLAADQCTLIILWTMQQCFQIITAASSGPVARCCCAPSSSSYLSTTSAYAITAAPGANNE